MQKNLLLGNGINLFLSIQSLSVKEIAKRFRKALCNSSCFYECLFNVSFSEKVCENLIPDDKGIEQLVGIVYQYVVDNTKCRYTENFDKRLVDELTGTAVNSIFFDRFGNVNTAYSDHDLSVLDMYENIYTLNYVEFWDKKNRCHFLHKKYNLPIIRSAGNPIVFYNRYRNSGIVSYRKLVESMKKTHHMIEFGEDLLIFAPDTLEKKKVINLAKYPSEDNEPSEDIFPAEEESLYEELNDISSIDLFGVSPYGEESLKEKLANIGHGIIYVHEKDEEQIKEWKKVLPSGFNYEDSSKFWKQIL